MSNAEFCAQRGHCWHEEGGVVYQRHSARPQGTTDATCCYCGKTAKLPMYAKAAAGKSNAVRHGKFSGIPELPPEAA